MNTETAAPRLIGKLALESVLPKDEVLAWLKAAALADPHGTPTQATLTNLEKFPFVACLAYPLEEAQTTPDRLLLPLSPGGYGHGSFLRAVDSIQVHLGGPRALAEGLARAIAATAAAQLGWADFKPKALNVQKPPRAKRKKFNSGDKARADLAIYLTLLKAIGAPLPSAEKIEGTPICELLTELHAFVIATCPRRLIHHIANGRNGSIAKHVRKFRAAFPCTKIKWAGDQMLELDKDDRSDNSAYRNLLADIYHCLVKANGGKTNWFEEFDTAKAGIVTWLNDKIKLVALRQINAPRQGCRIYTPDHAALDAIEDAATLFSDSARAFASTFTPDEEAQAAGLAMIRRYLSRMPQLPMEERREVFNGIEGLAEYYQFDAEQRAELEPELVVAREQHLGIEAVSEGSANFTPAKGFRSRIVQRAAKTKVQALRKQGLPEYCQIAPEDWTDVDPYVALPAAALPVEPAIEANLPEAVVEASVVEVAAVEVAAVEAAEPLPPLFTPYWTQFARPAKRPRRQKPIDPGQLCFATEWAKPTTSPTPTPPTSLPKAPVPPLSLGVLVAAFNQRSDRRHQRQAAVTRAALPARAYAQPRLKAPDPPGKTRTLSCQSPAQIPA